MENSNLPRIWCIYYTANLFYQNQGKQAYLILAHISVRSGNCNQKRKDPPNHFKRCQTALIRNHPDASLSGPKPVAFLQHGLLGEGSIWVTNLANNSLGFILADAGYDVWIGNSRGNTWCKRHLTLSPMREEFWAFSFDEMAKYDLPAMLSFIEQKTRQKQLYYIGHSQGTTIAFVAFSTLPELAQKIKLYVALAPVAAVKFVRSPLKNMTNLRILLVPLFVILQAMFGTKEFMPHTSFLELTNLQRALGISRKYKVLGLAALLCRAERNLRIDVYAAHAPAGTSVQNLIHWVQVAPPLYDVKNMNVPTAIWNGETDCLSDPRAVTLLLPQIPNLVYHKLIPGWNHLDFLLNLNVTEVLYKEIIDVMKKNP
uniref:Lipase n=1 Tax=Nothoprocta perdicaria TaxID=30464 RepID=A0A8C6ZKI5_NOTPE